MNGGRERPADAGASRADGDVSEFSRRRFLITGATAAAMAPFLGGAPVAAESGGHSGHGGHGDPVSETGPVAGAPRVPFTEGEPLIEPEVREAVDGVLDTTLRASTHSATSAATGCSSAPMKADRRGRRCGCSRGDTLKIKLINDLPPNRESAPGLHGPAAPAQRDQLPLPRRACQPERHLGQRAPLDVAGATATTSRSRCPDDHPAGTYWYHPHRHGGADIQIASGMAGVIVIEGDFDDVPEIAAARDRVMVLSEVVFDAYGMVEGFDVVFSRDRGALPHRQRPAGADHRHAPRRGAALAAPPRRPPGRHLPRARRAHAAARSPATASRWGTLDQAPLPLTSPDGTARRDADRARPADRRAGSGRRAGHLRAAGAALRPGISVAAGPRSRASW